MAFPLPIDSDRPGRADGATPADREQRRPRSVVAAKVADLPAGHGLDASTGQYVDMFAAGIVEPAKVTLAALHNAASIAALFFTTEILVADKPDYRSMADTSGGFLRT